MVKESVIYSINNRINISSKNFLKKKMMKKKMNKFINKLKITTIII